MGRVAIRWLLRGIACACLACGDASAPAPTPPADADPPAAARYVGAGSCGGCHADVVERWRGSHHQRAMQPASAETVLGDFSGVTLDPRGQRFRFERRGESFVIHTAGADDRPRDFEVLYTFGVFPLQQYLVALPGGRLQAVAAAWDARPAAAGGQRWLHLPEDEAVPPGDPLHWTGLAGSWNAMCADCHSTHVEKGYDAERNVYTPRWSAVDVSCEACHGPASRHLSWAQHAAAGDSGDDPSHGGLVPLADPHRWTLREGRPIAERVPARATGREVETCAPCHSRRTRIADAAPGAPFLDGHQPALIEPGLYFPDGQIRDEVYVWGSFVQSRMHAAGVACSDCHDPHALRIEEPDAACARCHRREVFASTAHHHHPASSPGASCVACHMPARTYMAVDARRDHSFRIPRPDLSRALGVPNACADCHAERGDAWAAAAIARWREGEPARGRHFGEVFQAADRRAPGASAQLAALVRDRSQPAIVRGSALRWLSSALDAESLPALLAALSDDDALVRAAAAGAAEALPAADRRVALAPLLRDPLRAVRIEAARVLAPEAESLGGPAARDLAEALAEYRDAQLRDADRPEARTNLGVLAARQGDLAEARRQLEAALRVGPFFVPASVSLAEVERREGREGEAERVLRQALARVPDAAEAHHALGLLLVRTGRSDEALRALGRAAELDPDTPRYSYVYGIGLHSVGDDEGALRVLEVSLRRHPGDAELLLALATLHRDAGHHEQARSHARRLLALRPGNPEALALLRELERGDASGNRAGSG